MKDIVKILLTGALSYLFISTPFLFPQDWIYLDKCDPEFTKLSHFGNFITTIYGLFIGVSIYNFVYLGVNKFVNFIYNKYKIA